jgi:ribosomal protein S18 acetylase RimI-like enzyme
MHKGRPDGHFSVSIDVEIRPATEADLPALEWLGLYSAHAPIIHEAFMAQTRGDALLLLGVSGSYPIAQVWIDFARKRSEGIAVLWAIRTFFPLQGRGIGQRMLAAAEDAVRARGLSRAELDVEVENAGALRFYQSSGWHRTGRAVTDFTSHGADGPMIESRPVWTMAKTLTTPMR